MILPAFQNKSTTDERCLFRTLFYFDVYEQLRTLQTPSSTLVEWGVFNALLIINISSSKIVSHYLLESFQRTCMLDSSTWIDERASGL